jgi:hypothetical protein
MGKLCRKFPQNPDGLKPERFGLRIQFLSHTHKAPYLDNINEYWNVMDSSEKFTVWNYSSQSLRVHVRLALSL